MPIYTAHIKNNKYTPPIDVDLLFCSLEWTQNEQTVIPFIRFLMRFDQRTMTPVSFLLYVPKKLLSMSGSTVLIGDNLFPIFLKIPQICSLIQLSMKIKIIFLTRRIIFVPNNWEFLFWQNIVSLPRVSDVRKRWQTVFVTDTKRKSTLAAFFYWNGNAKWNVRQNWSRIGTAPP